MNVIDRFRGPNRFLSNFWKTPVVYDGVVYPSVEHGFVAAKTLDPALRAEILTISDPGDVKRFGSRSNPRFVLRDGWDKIRLDEMRELLRSKFSDPTLARQLLATGDAALIEGNTHGDTFWGVCRGRGTNHLGRLLMELRAELAAGCDA